MARAHTRKLSGSILRAISFPAASPEKLHRTRQPPPRIAAGRAGAWWKLLSDNGNVFSDSRSVRAEVFCQLEEILILTPSALAEIAAGRKHLIADDGELPSSLRQKTESRDKDK